MKRIRIEVCPQKGRPKPWKVTKDSILWAECRTQADGIGLAVTLGHQYANRGELVTLKIKRPDGTIRDERSYGGDPRRFKG